MAVFVRKARVPLQRVILTHSSRCLKVGTSLLADSGHFLGRRWLPLGTLHRADVLKVHSVDLLECAALAFNDKEVDQQATKNVAACKDVTVTEIDILRNEWGEEGQKKIPKPVTGSRQGHSLCTVAGGENLGHDSPNHGSPGGCEPKDKEASHNNHGNSCTLCILRRRSIQGKVTNRGKDEE